MSDVNANETVKTVPVTVWYSSEPWATHPVREPLDLTVTVAVSVRRHRVMAVEPPIGAQLARATLRWAILRQVRDALGLPDETKITWDSEAYAGGAG